MIKNKYFPILTVTFAVFASTSVHAAPIATNIISEDAMQMRMVRITTNDDGSLTFEQCQKTSPDRVEGISCSLMGNQQKYTKAELQNIRSALRRNGLGIAVIDTVLVSGLVAMGFQVGALAGAGGEMGPAIAKVFGGMAVGGGAGLTTVILVDRLNPIRRFKGRSILNTILVTREGTILVKNIKAYTDELDWLLRY